MLPSSGASSRHFEFGGHALFYFGVFHFCKVPCGWKECDDLVTNRCVIVVSSRSKCKVFQMKGANAVLALPTTLISRV